MKKLKKKETDLIDIQYNHKKYIQIKEVAKLIVLCSLLILNIFYLEAMKVILEYGNL